MRLETLVSITTAFHAWFGLLDDPGLDAREMFADTALPLLAQHDREGAFMTIREDFLDRAQTLLDGVGRWYDFDAEYRATGIVEAVRQHTDPDVLERVLTEWA